MKNIKLLILVSVLVAGMLAGCAGGKVVEPTNTAADMPAMETPIVNNAYEIGRAHV